VQLNPYLHFDGQCGTAMRCYAQVLGGEIVAMIPHADTPAEQHVPAEWRDKIMHARLIVGERVLMASDVPPGCSKAMKGFAVTLRFDEPAEAERVFHALADGGTVRMPIQQTFWATRFGTPWMINCEAGAG